MKPVPPMPEHGPTPPLPSWVQSTWTGSRQGADRVSSENTELSPQKTLRAGAQWRSAPSTSHISRFMLVDARLNGDVAAFGPHGGASQLQVVFKGPDGVGEVAEYVYYFTDHDEGSGVFSRMSSSPHPYSLVLVPDVIDKGIPYHPLARS